MHWLMIIVLSVSVHAVFLLFYQSPPDIDGAKKEGYGGITVGLRNITKASPPPKAVAELVQQSAPEKTIPVTPEPKVEPVKKLVQEAKKAVKPKPKKQAVEKKPVPKKKQVPVVDQAVTSTISKVEQPVSSNVANSESIESSKHVKADAIEADSSKPTILGGGNPNADIQYKRRLQILLAKYKRYPGSAQRRGQEGQVTLTFTIGRDGQLMSYHVNEPSPYKLLNKAAVKTLKRAAPFPKIPEDMKPGQQTFTFTVPIGFSLK